MACKACLKNREKRKAALQRRAQRLAEKAARGDNGVQIIVPKQNQANAAD